VPSYQFGRLPAYPEDTHPRLKIGPFLRATTVPASVDWYTRVASWPMYLNDQIGDCTEAMVGHLIENSSTYGAGSTVQIADSDVLSAYERVSGYNPDDPSTDKGAVLQAVYGDWQKNGVGGHKATVFAQVDHTNTDQVKQAVEEFGAVGLGIVVTQDMMDAFHGGQPWTTADGQQLGGHAVPVVGYDAQNAYVVTWAKVQPMTWECFAKVTEESWVAILPEWLNSKGVDPEGVDLQGLGQAFSQLTGQPNPFQGPQPQPAPAPQPAPTPAPTPAVDSDRVLAKAARDWLAHRHIGSNADFATAVESWLKSKGL
jgi:hypothetical protein